MTKGKEIKLEHLKQQYPTVQFPEEVAKKIDIKDMRPVAKLLKEKKEAERKDILESMKKMTPEQIHSFRMGHVKEHEREMELREVERERVLKKTLIKQEPMKNKEISVHKIHDNREEQQLELSERQRQMLDERKQQQKLREHIKRQEKKVEKEIEEQEKNLDEQDRRRKEKHMETKKEKVVGIVVAAELGAAAITMATEVEEQCLETINKSSNNKTASSIDMNTAVTKTNDVEGNVNSDSLFPSFEERKQRVLEQYERNKENAPVQENVKDTTISKEDGFERERTLEKWG